MAELLQDPTFWFAVSFVIFLLLAVPVATKPVAAIFDNYAQKIRGELDEAKRLRAEAERLLQEAKNRQHAARHEAEEMLKQAKEQAEMLRSQGEKDLEAAIKRREAQAADHLRMLEAQAAADIRAYATQRALKAAEVFLQNNMSPAQDHDLVEKQIRQIGKA